MDEYKFPDETEEVKQEEPQDKFEVEIEDDTPEEDKGRTPLPKPLVEELEKDELDQYDENVKTRLKQMRKVWHDERREKEAALREHQEAVNFAQRILEENKRIKSILQTGEKEYVATFQNSATMELEMAKRAYKDAYDAGDADKIIEAQQAMQAANFKIMQARNFKLPALQEEEIPVQPRQEQYQQVPKPDSKAIAWQERNSWFGQDEEMTAAALGLHEKLKRQGVIVGSDEYYATLDKTIRKRFSENFEEPEEKPKQERAKPANVVAPATRSTASNKIRLKASQVQLAKKLGLTPEQYAKEVLRLENRNG